MDPLKAHSLWPMIPSLFIFLGLSYGKIRAKNDIKIQFQCDVVYAAVFLKQRMDTILMCSATKLLCSFSHIKLCTEIQLWCHFLYHLQCRWLSWAESLYHSRYNTCSTIACGDEACWSCVLGALRRCQPVALEAFLHSQEAHDKILFCGDLQSH